MDVKTTFLNGDLQEEIYMHQLEGFEEKGKDRLVCKLNKSLYGLKQAPREWCHEFHSFKVIKEVIHCLYTKRAKDGRLLILIIYVDDMLIARANIDDIASLKSKLNASFDMEDLGNANHILGMRIVRNTDKKALFIS